MIVYQLAVSVCITLFAVGYSPNKPTVSSVPNRFKKNNFGSSYLWLVLHCQKSLIRKGALSWDKEMKIWII
ncbi:hypothetical protein QFZ25_003058 [Bacillus atrophaeus]|nr:hypothetical protein [Bacillus atrophaeus]